MMAACIVFIALLTSCASPVVPDPVVSSEASFDGNAQNSGIVQSVPSGFIVTDHFRQRYNGLIAVYGGDYRPALAPDAGVAPMGDGHWLISKQHMVYFLEMNAWRKAALKPRSAP